MKISRGKQIFDIFNYFLLALLSATIILPFMNIISVSLSSSEAVQALKVGIFPIGLNFQSYKEILQEEIFLTSLTNSVMLTAAATIVSLVIDLLSAYAFSKNFYGKKAVNYFFIITMYFSGGLIPTYMLITKYLHWYNTYWALFVPGLVNVFYIIVVRTQIEAIPKSLMEAAVIDGAREYQVLFKVVIPSITATIAAIAMFIALTTWNMWFNVMIYTGKRTFWTLQYFLRAVVLDKTIDMTTENASAVDVSKFLPKQSYQMAAIILVALPIVTIYPFVQKYFVKGILAGSVKE